MTAAEQPRRRPGGRTAQVRARVHAAAIELLGAELPEAVTIPRVAERAGVHQATLYRRWGDVAGLVDDVVAERLGEVAPVPDTGTLRGDLELAAVRFVEAIALLGAIMMRAAALAVPTDEAPVALRTRADQLQAMLDRAAARGGEGADDRRAARRDHRSPLPAPAVLRSSRRRRTRQGAGSAPAGLRRGRPALALICRPASCEVL